MMAKEATLQVRMDAELKEQVEALYKRLGTSFAEAVRIFARQSVAEEGMPFVIHEPKKNVRGIAAKYANLELMQSEEGAFERAMMQKHENNS